MLSSPGMNSSRRKNSVFQYFEVIYKNRFITLSVFSPFLKFLKKYTTKKEVDGVLPSARAKILFIKPGLEKVIDHFKEKCGLLMSILFFFLHQIPSHTLKMFLAVLSKISFFFFFLLEVKGQ